MKILKSFSRSNIYLAIGTAALSTLAFPLTGLAATFEAAGDITTVVNNFRAAVGDPNNANAIGPLAEGRREINWDGAAGPFDMPPNAFNAFVPRGVEFSTDAGSEFRQSNPSAGDPTAPAGGDDKFNSINPTYADQFVTFSAPRLFTAVNTNVLDVNFFVPGTNIKATTNGFGAVFTDVDLPDSTQIEYYDAEDNLLLAEYVDPSPQGLSFLGATFDEGNLFRARITSGNTALGPDDDPANGIDVAVMDDFIHGEPQEAEVVPEPYSLLGILAVGALGICLPKRKQILSAVKT
jgi:hypothetical protein